MSIAEKKVKKIVEKKVEQQPDRSGSISPLAPAISLCETALRGHEEVQTRQRWSRAPRPKAHELEKARRASRTFARHRLPRHQPLKRSRHNHARYQGPNFRRY